MNSEFPSPQRKRKAPAVPLNFWVSSSTPFHSKHPCLLRNSTGLSYSFQISFWLTHATNGNYSWPVPLLLEQHLFFYDDHVTKPEDIQLFTDAAPSVGFGSYYGGRWFSSTWTSELSSLMPSSTIYEMYPVLIASILWGQKWSN